MMGRSAIIAVSLLLWASACPGGVWHVRPDGAGDAPTIQAAVDSALAGDTILLSDGTFTGPGNRDIIVEKSLTIRSESGDPTACVIDCQGSSADRHRAFLCDATHLLFEGFTVMNGYQSEAGALDLETNMDGQITVSRCRFINNNGGYGGAIRCLLLGYDACVISECVFEGNYSQYYGGCIFLERHLNPDGLCRIENCTFMGNYAYYGAALAEWLFEPPLGEPLTEDVGTHMIGCTIAANSGACSFFGTTMNGERLIIANNAIGAPFINSIPVLSCSNVFGNEGGDWIGIIEDQYRVRGNIRICPSFCSLPRGDLHLCDESSCLPGRHPDDYACGLLGALGAGCSCGPSATRPTTWGGIKAIYR
jgi:hypothetical protein